MQVLRSTDSLHHLGPETRSLIQQRIGELGEDADLATFVVVDPTDTADSLEATLGFGIVTFHGTRFGEPGFTSTADVVEEHPSFYELVFVLQDDGAGTVLIVPKLETVDAELLAFCAAYATA